jgi:hypothetical protein
MRSVAFGSVAFGSVACGSVALRARLRLWRSVFRLPLARYYGGMNLLITLSNYITETPTY